MGPKFGGVFTTTSSGSCVASAGPHCAMNRLASSFSVELGFFTAAVGDPCKVFAIRCFINRKSWLCGFFALKVFFRNTQMAAAWFDSQVRQVTLPKTDFTLQKRMNVLGRVDFLVLHLECVKECSGLLNSLETGTEGGRMSKGSGET